MTLSNLDSRTLNPTVSEILYPKSYLLLRMKKWIVIVILAISQQYSDPATMKLVQAQSILVWHTISLLYDPNIESC
jgi:hypothetical protein